MNKEYIIVYDGDRRVYSIVNLKTKRLTNGRGTGFATVNAAKSYLGELIYWRERCKQLK